MAVQIKTELTPLQQFEQLPEGPPYFELIHNQVFEMPPPSIFHQEISLHLTLVISAFLSQKAKSLGKLLFAPVEILLSNENVLEPDLLFVANERLNIIGKNRIYGAPDWVCEILSPSTRKRDLTEKRELYFKYGVKEYWIVDPENLTIEVLAGGKQDFESIGIFTGDQSIISNVFTDLTLKPSLIFNT